MRIVIDLQGIQTGSRVRGIGRYTLSLTQAILRNKGDHEVFLLLNGLFPETIGSIVAAFKDLLPSENIKIWNALGKHKGVFARPELLSIAEKVREAFLANLRPDFVLVTNLFDEEAIASIGHLKEAFPTAVILYDLIPLLNPDQNFQHNKQLRERYYRKLDSLKKAKLLLAISESSRQEALSSLTFTPQAVVNIFGGACSNAFYISEETKKSKDHVWEKWGIFKPFVMYTGGADERKNLERLIQAYAQLEDKIREKHQLVFVGHMPISNIERYKMLARSVGLTKEEFLILGYVSDEDILTLYNTCELFVFPSLHEGLGLPPMEAMLCGAPVISSNATSLPEVVGLEEALFDPHSVEAISAKMSQALIDTRFWTRLTEHAKKQVIKFSWDESAKRALHAMEQIAPKRPINLSPLLNIEKKSNFLPRKLRILAIKLDHLGDLLLVVPALTKLKKKYPHALLDIIVGSWNVPVAESLGLFNQIFTYDFFKKKSSEQACIAEQELEELLLKLGMYDIAIDFRRQPDTRFLLVKTKAQLKVGYETQRPEIDQPLNITLPISPDVQFKATSMNHTPMSQQLIALVNALPNNDNDAVVLPQIVKNSHRKPRTIAIFPKAGNEVKEWGATNFINLINQLLTSHTVQEINLYFANQAEAVEYRELSHPKLHQFIGLQFQELAQSLAKNELCITNDSGGSHLAAYLGVTPIVIFSGRELSEEWGPQFNEGYVISYTTPCSPCHIALKTDCPYALRCINNIPVEDVYLLTRELLERGASKKARELFLQKSTDTLVAELIDAVAEDARALSEEELVAFSKIISADYPTYSMVLADIKVGETLDHRSQLLEWVNFSYPEAKFRWTNGYCAEIHFMYSSTQPSSNSLFLQFETFGKQCVSIHFNNMPVYTGSVKGEFIELHLQLTNLQPGFNVLVFKLPGAKTPGNGDPRKLALAVRKVRIGAEVIEREKAHFSLRDLVSLGSTVKNVD